MIVIFGATSDIAKNVAKEFANDKKDLLLVARNDKENKKFAKELKNNYKIEIKTAKYDALNLKELPDLVKSFGKYKPKGLFVAHGYMPNENQKLTKSEIDKTNLINFESTKIICNEFLNNFPKSKFIAVISSVAGDVEKKRTLYYGKSKAKLSKFLIELRNKSKKTKIIDIKPGPTRTRMTQNMKLPFGGAKPERVAKDIFNGIKNENETIYTPFYWKHIMKIIKIMPKKIRDKL